MHIGRLAEKAGVNIQTIRFYEREHILDKAARNPSGYRSYGDNDLTKLQFIQKCKELGFSLREIKQLLQLHSAVADLPSGASRKAREWRDISRLTRIKLQSIEQKMRALKAIRIQLLSMLDKLETTSAVGCPAPSKNIRKN